MLPTWRKKRPLSSSAISCPSDISIPWHVLEYLASHQWSHQSKLPSTFRPKEGSSSPQALTKYKLSHFLSSFLVLLSMREFGIILLSTCTALSMPLKGKPIDHLMQYIWQGISRWEEYIPQTQDLQVWQKWKWKLRRRKKSICKVCFM